MSNRILIHISEHTALTDIPDLSEKIVDACGMELSDEAAAQFVTLKGTDLLFDGQPSLFTTTEACFIAELLSDHVVSGTAFVIEEQEGGHKDQYSVTRTGVVKL